MKLCRLRTDDLEFLTAMKKQVCSMKKDIYQHIVH